MADSDAPKIQKLHEDVVNRIAAGEVIQRPANAVKEMLENSLDAGSTSITVSCKQGGLKVLQIQDNGHGIKKEDLDIVCERFTTSKLQKFEDLRKIATFGFRGEALASITHVARVTITTKTKSSPCAYKAHYLDGHLAPAIPGGPSAPQPCAGVQGTTIMAEDLFHNMPTRRRAFGTGSEQYARVLDVMTKYAVHFGDRGVSFTCKKHGLPASDLHTPKGGSSLGAIRIAYGQALARELLPLEAAHNKEREEEESFAFEIKGYVSNANYSAKKAAFILFINDRLVECPGIRKTVEAAYVDVLPKGSRPFAYLALRMPPAHLDVNVHPTKQEVHFLHEDRLLGALLGAVEGLLRGANKSRTFYAQASLPSSFATVGRADRVGEEVGPEKKKAKYVDPRKLVRVDARARSLNDFFQAAAFPTQSQAKQASATTEKKEDGQASSPGKDHSTENQMECLKHDGGPSKQETKGLCEDGHDQSDDSPAGSQKKNSALILGDQQRPGCRCAEKRAAGLQRDHVLLLHDIRDNCHKEMRAMLAKHTFVGVATQTHSLVQHETKLLLINHYEMGKEMFYQLAIRRFGCAPRLHLSRPPAVLPLVRAALDLPDTSWREEDGDKDVLARDIVQLLLEKAEMLNEYFNVDIRQPEGAPGALLAALPELLEGHRPLPAGLPGFLLRLATEVDWTEEEACFEGVASELAALYATLEEPEEEEEGGGEEGGGGAGGAGRAAEEAVAHVLFPAFRWALLPPREFANAAAAGGGRGGGAAVVAEVAALERLYKVFERC
ncbi:unnamed protein product [Heterosigma akashiwo]